MELGRSTTVGGDPNGMSESKGKLQDGVSFDNHMPESRRQRRDGLPTMPQEHDWVSHLLTDTTVGACLGVPSCNLFTDLLVGVSRHALICTI